MTSALVLLANGSEEMEAVIVIDVLRRAEWNVVTAGLEEGVITASRGVRLVPDTVLSDVDTSSFDLLFLPGGGPGTAAMCADTRVLDTVSSFHDSGRTVAAICAAPLVLQEAGILDGVRATCHPAVADELVVTERHTDRVVKDGNIFTSQGPGTAMEFALALVAAMSGEDAVRKVIPGLVLPPGLLIP
ncbi:MAG: DJ-1/PfpI family protein [Lentisphaerae bacterium]|nr:DJ-1/PfpI family protein [Lentisphaerota bacterium]